MCTNNKTFIYHEFEFESLLRWNRPKYVAKYLPCLFRATRAEKKKSLNNIFVAMVLHRCCAFIEVVSFTYIYIFFYLRCHCFFFGHLFCVFRFTLHAKLANIYINICENACATTSNRSVIFMSTILYYRLGMLAKLVRFF